MEKTPAEFDEVEAVKDLHVKYKKLTGQLGGVIGGALFGGLIPVIRRRLREDELRAMQAADASS